MMSRDVNEFLVTMTAIQVLFLMMLLLGSSGTWEILSVSALFGTRVLKVN